MASARAARIRRSLMGCFVPSLTRATGRMRCSQFRKCPACSSIRQAGKTTSATSVTALARVETCTTKLLRSACRAESASGMS